MIALQNVNIIDVKNNKILNNKHILIQNDKIHKISINDDDLKNYKVINCTNKYVVPGMFECHAHLCGLSKHKDKNKILSEFVEKGITQVRDVGGSLNVLKKMKEEINAGDVIGPEIFYAGPMLESGKLTWEDNNKVFPEFTVSINNNQEVDEILNKLQKNKASLAKTFGRIKPNIIKYFVEEAKKRNINVAHDVGGPIFNFVPINMGLKFGITCFEHGKSALTSVLTNELQKEHDDILHNRSSNKGMELFQKIINAGENAVSLDKLKKLSQELINKNAFLCPTLLVSEFNLDEHPKESHIILKFINKISTYLTKKMIEYGVKMLVGVDDRRPFTFKEMTLLSNLGLSTIEILRGASIYPATWLGVDNNYGSIEENKKANLLVLNTNPLLNIENINDKNLVVKNGVVY